MVKTTEENFDYISQRALGNFEIYAPMRDAGTIAQEFIENGAKDLGVARNTLIRDLISAKVSSCLEFQPETDLPYGSSRGSVRLRKAFGEFYSKHMNTAEKVTEDHVIVAAGTGAALFHLTMVVADPGDVVLVPAPYYGNFDVHLRTSTGVDFVMTQPFSASDFKIDFEKMEAAVKEAESNGKHVAAVLLANPNNPLGRCHPEEDLKKLLQFANSHSLHVIVDEIYALSTFGHFKNSAPPLPNPFVSILSIQNLKELIDPKLVHVVYGMSKDFGINGFRVSFAIDQYNSQLRNALVRESFVSHFSSISDRLIANILSDTTFLDKLIEGYQRAVDILESYDIPYYAAEAGHFIWIDARKFLIGAMLPPREPTTEDEVILWCYLLEGGVYVVPGHAFHAEKAGFFRATFALDWDTINPAWNLLCQLLTSFDIKAMEQAKKEEGEVLKKARGRDAILYE
ncbi:hypothetical protein EC973_004045 [Apophysomyces ossiformis]|uniref:Aminotransferase class I/classII large domain-containing protein n=1 Tax=Apophysomyces ossiformis TaxID=679940 RepID=A0A8H7ERJ4_9FUNG|nr:hypothetical protein EC973_004045 [Apophysomyces ossiformis]